MNQPLNLDAVAMVRRIRDEHYRQLKGASVAERIAFYNQAIGPTSEHAPRTESAAANRQ